MAGGKGEGPVHGRDHEDGHLTPETAAGHEELETREDAGDAALETACTTIKTRNSVLTPESGCFTLQFDNASGYGTERKMTSSFKIDTTGVAAVSIFTQHVPKEFERDTHYLKDVNGDDVEPVAELPETVTPTKSKPWSDAIGAAIVVNIVTLSGVIFLSPSVAKKQKAYPEVVSCIINAFAAGALLSAAFYLMLYEATHLIKPAVRMSRSKPRGGRPLPSLAFSWLTSSIWASPSRFLLV